MEWVVTVIRKWCRSRYNTMEWNRIPN